MTTTIQVLTAFANTHADEAKAACGFPGSCSYIYDSDNRPGWDVKPNRAFADSNGTVYLQGMGFPDDTVVPDFSGLAGGPPVCCVNGEFHKPHPWGEIRPQMQWIGQMMFATLAAAQSALARYQTRCLIEARKYCPAVGMFGRAPFEPVPALERAVLMHATAWMPSLYVWNTSGASDRRTIDPSGLPATEIIPVLCGLYSYGDGLVSVAHWCEVLTRAVGLGANRAILWADCESPDSVAEATVIGDRMREAATAIGVELV